MGSTLDDLEKGSTGLLDEVGDGESLGLAWKPGESRDDGSTDPEGIEGVVVSRFTVQSDDTYGPSKEVPCVVLRNADGLDWQVRGYRGILADEITEKDPQPGDTYAVKYLGQPKGKRYHVYKSAVRKGVPGTVPPAKEDTDSGKPPF